MKAMESAFSRFWRLRGGPPAFERWRVGGQIPELLVHVTGPNFCAGFVIDDQVRICAPILRRHLMGKTETEARAIIEKNGWTATVTTAQQLAELQKAML